MMDLAVIEKVLHLLWTEEPDIWDYMAKIMLEKKNAKKVEYWIWRTSDDVLKLI